MRSGITLAGIFYGHSIPPPPIFFLLSLFSYPKKIGFICAGRLQLLLMHTVSSPCSAE